MRKSSSIAAAPATLEQARAVKAQAVRTVRRIVSDAAVGLTRVGGGYGLKVNLTQPLKAGEQLPARIEGVPMITETVGKIRKRA